MVENRVMAQSDKITELRSRSITKSTARKLANSWTRRLLPIAALALLALPFTQDVTSAREVSVPRSDTSSFSQARFDRAQAEGRLILVETYADWCAPCRIQAPIVERLRRERRYRNLVLLRIDEETPRSVWNDMGLVGYGQFAVFRGDQEVGRGSPLNEAEMRALLSG